MRQTDILISGGGIAGLTLAKLLSGLDLKIDVIEPHPPASFKKTDITGRTVALMDSSLNVIKAANIWDSIKDQSCPMKAMRIIDDSRGDSKVIETDFEAREIGMKEFGYNIPNALLRAALFDDIKKVKNIKIHNSAFTSFSYENTAIIASFEDGSKLKASLLTGADGRNSSVRKAANITSHIKKYDQSAITCIINHSRTHNSTATEFHRSGGPFALVPMPGNQSSVVWVEKHERAENLLRLKKHEFEQALEKNSNRLLGGITLETTPISWPLSTIKANKLTVPRIALIAEAAHVMSPITAQGLNLSLRDVAALAEVIADALRVGLDIGSNSVLNKYEKRRSLDIDTRVFGVDSMNKLVSNDISIIRDLRRLGLKATAQTPPLKRFAMKHGLAPQIDLGRLASGKTL